jgi:hypothetical protein
MDKKNTLKDTCKDARTLLLIKLFLSLSSPPPPPRPPIQARALAEKPWDGVSEVMYQNWCLLPSHSQHCKRGKVINFAVQVIYVCMCTHTFTRTHARTHTHSLSHTHAHTHNKHNIIYAFMYVCMYRYVRVCNIYHVKHSRSARREGH